MNYLIWKGVNSSTITGLVISELPPITKPKMKVSETHIDGVDGSVFEELGYQAYDKKVKIGLKGNYNINQVISYFSGEGDIVFSSEPNKYYKARIIDSVDYDRLLRFRTADVKFRVQPFKKLVGEVPVNYECSVVNGTSPSYSQEVPNNGIYARVNKIGGKSVVMNQLVRNGNFVDMSVWNSHSFTKSASLNIGRFTNNKESSDSHNLNNPITFQVGHKYFVGFGVKITGNNIDFKYNLGGSIYSESVEVGIFKRVEQIKTSNVSYAGLYFYPWGIGNTAQSTSDYIELDNVICIDLTQMFGSGNEPSTVAQFKAMFPKDYYAYNTGSIVSAGCKQVVVKDDDSVVTSTTQIPQSIQSLTGYGWSAGTVYNEVDYANKKYIQRVSRVDLGSLNWINAENAKYYTSGLSQIVKFGGDLICSKYGKSSSWQDKCVFIGSTGNVGVNDTSYSGYTVDQFKTAMNGVYLYYELATPITTDISSLIDSGFIQGLDIETGGSITFVSDTDDNYRLPVPNETKFFTNTTKQVTVTNSGNHTSKPIIRIYGSGTIYFKLDGITQFAYTFQSGDAYVDIDCEKQDAYVGSTLKNRSMTGSFPTLHTGNNIITWTGAITQMQFSNYSRWL